MGIFLSRPKPLGLHLTISLAPLRLWKEVVCPILVSLLSTIVFLVVLFSAALEPQAVALINAGWPSVLAWFSAVLLVLAETALVNIILMLVKPSAAFPRCLMFIYIYNYTCTQYIYSIIYVYDALVFSVNSTPPWYGPMKPCQPIHMFILHTQLCRIY